MNSFYNLFNIDNCLVGFFGQIKHDSIYSIGFTHMSRLPMTMFPQPTISPVYSNQAFLSQDIHSQILKEGEMILDNSHSQCQATGKISLLNNCTSIL